MKSSVVLLVGGMIGVVATILATVLVLLLLPKFIVTENVPHSADAIIVLGGDGSRLQSALKLQDEKLAPYLVLVSNKRKNWAGAINKYCPSDCWETRKTVFLEGSIDTRTDAQLTLDYCLENNLTNILIVTSPYHTRRAQIVFNHIFNDSGIETTVISSGEYDNLVPPDGPWWRDRKTVETIWLEFGKILYWELTPFMEFKSL